MSEDLVEVKLPINEKNIEDPSWMEPDLVYKDVEVYDDVLPPMLVHAFWHELMYMHRHVLQNRSNPGNQSEVFYHIKMGEGFDFLPSGGNVGKHHALCTILLNILSTGVERLKEYDLDIVRIHHNLQYPNPRHDGSFHEDWHPSEFNQEQGIYPFALIFMLSPDLPEGAEGSCFEFKELDDDGEEKVVSIPYKMGRFIVMYDNIDHRGQAPDMYGYPARVTTALKVRGIKRNVN